MFNDDDQIIVHNYNKNHNIKSTDSLPNTRLIMSYPLSAQPSPRPTYSPESIVGPNRPSRPHHQPSDSFNKDQKNTTNELEYTRRPLQEQPDSDRNIRKNIATTKLEKEPLQSQQSSDVGTSTRQNEKKTEGQQKSLSEKDIHGGEDSTAPFNHSQYLAKLMRDIHAKSKQQKSQWMKMEEITIEAASPPTSTVPRFRLKEESPGNILFDSRYQKHHAWQWGHEFTEACRCIWGKVYTEKPGGLYCRHLNLYSSWESVLGRGDCGLWNLSSVFTDTSYTMPGDLVRGGVVYHNKGTSEEPGNSFEETQTKFLPGELICGLIIISHQLQKLHSVSKEHKFALKQMCYARIISITDTQLRFLNITLIIDKEYANTLNLDWDRAISLALDIMGK